MIRVGALALFGFGLLVAGLLFFWKAIELIGQKDYVGSVLVVGIGLGTMQAASELLRLLYVERDS